MYIPGFNDLSADSIRSEEVSPEISQNSPSTFLASPTRPHVVAGVGWTRDDGCDSWHADFAYGNIIRYGAGAFSFVAKIVGGVHIGA